MIAASLLIYRDNRWWPSVILAALACLVRETAFPYLLVMGAFALYGRRWRQASGWLLAVLVFAGFFSWHISEASNFHKAGDLVSQGWLGFGGWNFVIATAKWNIVLHVLPAPLIALAICLGLLGLAGASDARARRAAVIVASYLAALLVIGRLDNYYWGILYTPLLPLGFIFAPQALRDLIERARPAAASAA